MNFLNDSLPKKSRSTVVTTSIHRYFPRKVSMSLDKLGSPILIMTEETPEGVNLYYMQPDGSWKLYDPAKDAVEPFSNSRFELKS